MNTTQIGGAISPPKNNSTSLLKKIVNAGKMDNMRKRKGKKNGKKNGPRSTRDIMLSMAVIIVSIFIWAIVWHMFDYLDDYFSKRTRFWLYLTTLIIMLIVLYLLLREDTDNEISVDIG